MLRHHNSVDIKLHIILNVVKTKLGIICEYISNKLKKKKTNIILYVKRNPREEYTMVHDIETKLNYSLMNLTGHIYICNAQKLPILSCKSMATVACLFSDLYASCSQLSKSGLLWPLNQIQPATCFRMALELRMVFTCLNNGEKKSKEEYS